MQDTYIGDEGKGFPLVLIHGFLGWGREEMAGYYYWGGRSDLESHLRDAGHKVYTVSVGPISSNFDRAIEAFYQIKGGQVDYGIEHSKKYINSENMGILDLMFIHATYYKKMNYSDISLDEKEKLFFKNAEKYYRI